MYELDNPQYLYALALIPVALVLFFLYRAWQKRQRKAFGESHLLRYLAPERSQSKPWLKFILLLLALASLIIALVNPRIGTRLETVKRVGVDLVFAVDVSRSMLAEDVQPNRLAKAKQIISRCLDQLVSDRVGMIAYAGRAYPQLPITTDYNAARLFLRNISTDIVPSQGTDIAGAIELAASYYDDEEQKNRLLVLLSDGEDHEAGYETAAREARAQGVQVIGIGIGTERGGPIPQYRNGRQVDYKRDAAGEVVITRLETQILREIARLTDGGYHSGSDTRNAVKYIMDYLRQMEKKEFETQQYADYEDQFQWFLGLALFFLVLEMLMLERKTQWFKRLKLFDNDPDNHA